VVKGTDIEKDTRAPQKVPTKPAKQEKDRTLEWQHYVEHALQVLYGFKWLDTDPGKSDDINDGKTQAALKEFQEKFKLTVDGKIGPQTLGALAEQLPASTQQHAAQVMLGKLFAGKKLQHDPGPPDGVNNPKTRDAVEEFQSQNGRLV